MYSKVLYIDADIVFVRSIDELFDLPTWAVPMDPFNPAYNTGMMLLRPSLKTFDDMVEKLQSTKTSTLFGELFFITEYHNALQKAAAKSETSPPQIIIHFISRWYQVYQHQFLRGHKSFLTEKKESITIYDHRIHGIHYTGPDKPWVNFTSKFTRYSPSLCSPRNEQLFPNEAAFIWYILYSKMRLSYSYMKETNSNITSDLRPLNLSTYLRDQKGYSEGNKAKTGSQSRISE